MATVSVGSANAQKITKPDTKGDAKIAYIVAGMTDARTKIHTFEATTKYYHFDPKEVSAMFNDLFSSAKMQDKEDVTNIWLVRHWLNDTVHKSSVTYIVGNSEAPNTTVTVLIEQEQAKTLSEFVKVDKEGKETKSYQGSIVPRTMAFKSSFTGDAHDCNPISLAYPAGTGLFIDDMLRKKNYSVSYLGEEIMDTVACYKMQQDVAPGDRRVYWIDKEHGFMVRRTEFLEKVSGKWLPSTVTRVLRVQESNGVWLPVLVETTVSFALIPPFQVGGEKYGRLPDGISRDKVVVVNGVLTVPGRFYRYTVENMRVNEPVSPENLVIEWPANSYVYDRILSKLVDTKPKEQAKTDEKKTP